VAHHCWLGRDLGRETEAVERAKEVEWLMESQGKKQRCTNGLWA